MPTNIQLVARECAIFAGNPASLARIANRAALSALMFWLQSLALFRWGAGDQNAGRAGFGREDVGNHERFAANWLTADWLPSHAGPNGRCTTMTRTCDVVIVGAGFAGLYMLQKLRTAGLRCVVIEAGDDVGGTWYWNRYPGARCDVESVHYSYSFSAELDQEWTWTERYAGQPEILRYLQHVADRFDLRRDIQFSTRVASAAFDEGTLRWDVTTKTGDTYNARFCIMATGCLSTINRPDIAGCADFQGPIYHTGNWPHEKVDFTGLRVGIIGTGSSACQAIPLIANEARELIVLQRTPNHCVPAHNHPLPHDYVEHIKSCLLYTSPSPRDS